MEDHFALQPGGFFFEVGDFYGGTLFTGYGLLAGLEKQALAIGVNLYFATDECSFNNGLIRIGIDGKFGPDILGGFIPVADKEWISRIVFYFKVSSSIDGNPAFVAAESLRIGQTGLDVKGDFGAVAELKEHF